MAGTNTEKPTGKAEQKKAQSVPKVTKSKIEKAPVKKEVPKKPAEPKTETKPETKTETKPAQKKEEKVEVKKVKKEIATVNATNSHVSTKYAVAICKFLKGKSIEKAIKDLEEVSNLRKAVPMKGEIAHRKGKMMSGKFPVRASKEFIILLKSLMGNANQHDLDEPIITLAVANKGTTTYGRMGRVQKKRSNIKIVASEKKLIKQNKKKK